MDRDSCGWCLDVRFPEEPLYLRIGVFTERLSAVLGMVAAAGLRDDLDLRLTWDVAGGGPWETPQASPMPYVP